MKCYYTTREYGMSLVRGRTYERLASGTLLGCRVVIVQSYGRHKLVLPAWLFRPPKIRVRLRRSSA
jgi:hypothetical protein